MRADRRGLAGTLCIALAAIAGAVAGTVTAMAGPTAAYAAGPMPLFQLPFQCGATWRLETRRGHHDYDIDMTASDGGGTEGRPILAAYGGTVVSAGWDSGGGNFVRIDHGDDWQTRYLHMIASPLVSVGQTVRQGQQLGNVGSTGNSEGPHLHYEQLRDGTGVASKSEAYFDGVASGITSDGSASHGPIYVEGPVSPAQIRTSRNCRPVAVGDVSGDGYADLVATRADGTLWFYGNSWNSDSSHPYGAGRQIGTGWSNFAQLALGDVSGDGYADIVGTKRDGTL
jgi:Peptidase family M23